MTNTARQMMNKDFKTCHISDSAFDALKLILDDGESAVICLDSDDKLYGILTEKDFVPSPKPVPHTRGEVESIYLGSNLLGKSFVEYRSALAQLTVLDVLGSRKTVHTVSPHATLVDVLTDFKKFNVRRLPVVDKGEVVGLVTFREVARHQLP